MGRDPGTRPAPLAATTDQRLVSVAACCLARGLPLATLNIKDYADFAEHESLELLR